MKPSGIGGMAVIEGVMMKNKDQYAVAVRKPDNEIVIEKNTHKSLSDKVKLFKLPIFRGMLAFVDSMVIGVKILSFSASFFEEEEETPKKIEKDKNKNAKKNSNTKNIKQNTKIKNNEKSKKKEKDIKATKDIAATKEETGLSALMMVAAVAMSIVISISFFMILPFLASQLFEKLTTNAFILSLIEGLLRIGIFVGYVAAVSHMEYIKRVFMYHGAEHKTINCLENGFELSVENVKWQSKHHKRCGTSFMLLVIFISTIFFIFIKTDNIAMRIIIRVILVPIIAGISYEFIRLAGKSEAKIVNIISKPGMWMQALTTKEPDDSMIEVAIKSVEAVFDWRGFLEIAAVEEKSSQVTSKVSKIEDEKDKEINKVSNKESNKESNIEINKEPNKEITKASSQKEKVKVIEDNSIKPINTKKSEDEDDDILKALDKYLDFGNENVSSLNAEEK